MIWCVKNHPYEYAYFNEFAGGFSKAFYNYDTDYWEISVKNGLERLIRQEHLDNTKDSVILATNTYSFTNYYIQRHYPGSKIIVVPSGEAVRNSVNWKYAIFNSVFLKPEYLENYFPPGNYLMSENIDGIPVTFVMRDSVRLDILGTNALRAANYQLADSLFTAYVQTTNDCNPGLYPLIALAKASLLQNDVAINYASKSLQYHLAPIVDYYAYCALGVAYANKHEVDASIQCLSKARKLAPDDPTAAQILMQVYKLQQLMGNRQ